MSAGKEKEKPETISAHSLRGIDPLRDSRPEASRIDKENTITNIHKGEKWRGAVSADPRIPNNSFVLTGPSNMDGGSVNASRTEVTRKPDCPCELVNHDLNVDAVGGTPADRPVMRDFAANPMRKVMPSSSHAGCSPDLAGTGSPVPPLVSEKDSLSVSGRAGPACQARSDLPQGTGRLDDVRGGGVRAHTVDRSKCEAEGDFFYADHETGWVARKHAFGELLIACHLVPDILLLTRLSLLESFCHTLD